jgi:hypothetical protein
LTVFAVGRKTPLRPPPAPSLYPNARSDANVFFAAELRFSEIFLLLLRFPIFSAFPFFAFYRSKSTLFFLFFARSLIFSLPNPRPPPKSRLSIFRLQTILSQDVATKTFKTSKRAFAGIR